MSLISQLFTFLQRYTSIFRLLQITIYFIILLYKLLLHCCPLSMGQKRQRKEDIWTPYRSLSSVIYGTEA